MPIWDRDPSESRQAYRAFRAYRDMGPGRSIDSAWRKTNLIQDDSRRAPGFWFIWSTDYGWLKRAEAWDAHIEKIEQEEFEKRVRELGRRRAEFEFRLQEKLEKRFEKLEEQLEKAEQAPITDVTRIEGEGVAKVVVKVKGKNLSGYARLHKEFRDTGTQAVLGPRSIENDDPAPEPMPPFVIETTHSPADETETEPPAEQYIRRQ